MGKDWRGDKGSRGGRGGRGGGPNANGLQSCRGHAVIIGTCDVVRERESNKEMISLLNEAVEKLQEQGELPKPDVPEEDEDEGADGEGTMADMLAAEIKQVKEKKGLTQDFFSVNSNIKGVIVIKFMRKDVCPVRLCKMIFDRVKEEKQSYSRHLCRLVPCTNCFYPNGKELVQNIRALMSKEVEDLERELPTVEYPPEPEKSNKEKKRELRREEERVARAAERAEKLAAKEEKEGLETTGEGETGEAGMKRPAEQTEEGEGGEEEPQQKQRKLEEDEKEKKETTDEGTKEEAPDTEVEDAADTAHAVTIPEPVKVWEGESKFKPFTFDIAMKSRAHCTLSKVQVKEFTLKNLPKPPRVKLTYKKPEVRT